MTQIAHRFSREPSTTGAELTDSARAEIEQIVTELTEHMRMTRPMTRGERSREWLALFFETAKAADVLAETDFVPPSMKGKPKQVATAIMKGYELDIDPLDALANIYIVHGRVGFSAEFMRRRIIQAGHEIRVTEASDSRAVLEGCRRGAEEWQRAVFTAAQAHKAKIDLAGYPEDKLIARATSRLCKRAFPDVLSGAAIVEDLADDYAAGATAAGAVTEALRSSGGENRHRKTPRPPSRPTR